MALALFDLDHTLLDGDSDVLWCQFLLAEGVLDASFENRNQAMALEYQAGTVSPQAFCEFYVSTLAGRTAAQWQGLRLRYLDTCIVPRIPPAARGLLQQHRAQGDTLVLTTATNHFLTELTARHLGIEHLLATTCERDEAGVFTGRTQGTLNMREGKVQRMHAWLQQQALPADALATASFYSDSINDLPLLQAVGHPVAVNPDTRLHQLALARGWPVQHLRC